MQNQPMPYITRNPGDLLSAGDWNQMQLDIKQDLLATKEATKEEIREEGVNMAGNSEKFDNKSSTEWVAQLDERYAQKVHDHEEIAGYRRYIKRFNDEDDIALLDHGLGRYPLVDIYQLLDVVGLVDDKKILQECPQLAPCKLFVYYGHREAERYGLMGNIHRRKIKIGIPLEMFLTELGVQYEDDDTLGDVLNDMLDAFMEDPNDEITHCRSDWIEESVKDRRKVQELKEADEWPDIKVALAPQQVRGDTAVSYIEVDTGQENEAGNPLMVKVAVSRRVNALHANYETTAVFVEKPVISIAEAVGADIDLNKIKEQVNEMDIPLDLMVLIRS